MLLCRRAQARDADMLIALTILLAFCGGPLLLCDHLAPSLGPFWAFALCFSPLFSIAMGALSSDDPVESRLGRLFASSGLLGTALLALIDAWALWMLLSDQVEQNLGLHWLGVFAGVFACLGYVQVWSRGYARSVMVFGEHTQEISALAVSLAFTFLGLWLYPHDPELGASSALLFGGMSVVFIHSLRTKLDPERPATHELPPAQLRRRRRRTGALLCAWALGMLWLSPSYPLLFRLAIGLLALFGLLLAIAPGARWLEAQED